jgi:outer membrane lipoprotein SlyB
MATGAGIGAVGGGVLGNVLAGKHHKTTGTLIGAGTGALLGGAIGHQSDMNNRQQQQINAMGEQANTTIINVTNSNGSVTPVTLRRVGTQWVGPRGEYYTNLPSPEQLKPVYGF